MSGDRRDKKGRFLNRHPDSKYAVGRSKKRPRRFLGHTDSDAQDSKKSRRSTSATKLKRTDVQGCEVKNRIVDINILFPELEKILCCNVCHGSVQIVESSVQGLGFKILVKCQQCGELAAINSSKRVGTAGNACEINRRSVLAARALSQGYAGLSTFCGIMDLPKPVAHSAFNTINEKLSEVCEEVAQESMNEAVKEESDATLPNSAGLDVSGDGSWRKRGFSSLQGIASIIGNKTSKVLDVVIKNSYCKSCTQWEEKKGTSAYDEWYETHVPNCTANHQGSAGSMEVKGICEMFQRSQEKYGVKYHQYIGDGDSKVFKEVTETKPYGNDLLVKKKECVGHVQKRMGTRLRNLKKSLAGKLLSDGKSIGGKGRLTAQIIDQLTSYYGKAIRDHSDSVEEMSNAIWASFYHKQSTNQNPQHHLCPKGINSWCKWQKAKALKRLKTFKHTQGIPSAIMEKIKPIYEDLTKEELLEKCIGGYTQNSNESFNNSVWKLVSKTSFSGMSVLKIGVYTAVTCFNDGRSGFLKIMKKFNVEPGTAATEWVKASDDTRLFHAERKIQANTIEARSLTQKARLKVPEDSYGPGAY